MLKISEIFTSIQGEGYYAGKPANFIRLHDCNLRCPFCDTHIKEYKEMDEDDIIKSLNKRIRHVVITGGEPLLQDIIPLCLKLRTNDYLIQIESNGTQPLKAIRNHTYFITISPKLPLEEIHKDWVFANEIKFLCGKPMLNWYDVIKSFFQTSKARGKHTFIQPIWLDTDPSTTKENIDEAYRFAMTRPGVRLSLQLHKIIGVK